MGRCTCSWSALRTSGRISDPWSCSCRPPWPGTSSSARTGAGRFPVPCPGRRRVPAPSWFTDAVCEVLHRHRAALIWADRRRAPPESGVAHHRLDVPAPARRQGHERQLRNKGDRRLCRPDRSPRPRRVRVLQQRHHRQRGAQCARSDSTGDEPADRAAVQRNPNRPS